MPVELVATPRELRGVQPGHLDDADLHVAPLVEELSADRIDDAVEGVLRSAVRGLNRDAPVGESRAHLHNRATIAGPEAAERGLKAPDRTEVGHVGHASELVRGQLPQGGVDGDHGVVDPDVELSQLLLDLPRGSFELLRVRDVSLDQVRCPPGGFDVLRGAFEASPAPSDQPDGRAVLGELDSDRASEPCRCSGDRNGLTQSAPSSQGPNDGSNG